MALYVDSTFLNSIMEVARTVPLIAPEVLLDMAVDPMIEDAMVKFTHDWHMMKKL